MKNKTFFTTLFLAFGFMFYAPSVAQHQAGAQYIYTCEAESPVAVGVGMSPNIYAARSIALNECRMRTPYGMYCVVTSCY